MYVQQEMHACTNARIHICMCESIAHFGPKAFILVLTRCRLVYVHQSTPIASLLEPRPQWSLGAGVRAAHAAAAGLLLHELQQKHHAQTLEMLSGMQRKFAEAMRGMRIDCKGGGKRKQAAKA